MTRNLALSAMFAGLDPGQPPQTAQRVGTAPLNERAVYLSPLNRRWRLVAMVPVAADCEVAHFVYDTPNGRRAYGSMADGFSLTSANFHFLRRVA